MMQEYYIRNPDSDESRGPFTVDQLMSLGETGHITLETYIYNHDTEEWELLEHSPELKAAIFPEKKRLTMKAKGEFESLNKGELDIPPITINDLLAAAEGNTEETKHRKKEGVWREKAVGAAMYLSGLVLLISAIGLIWLQREAVFAFDLERMIASPLVIFAVLDLAVALLLFLQSSSVYPFIRFRSMAGAGFFLFFFWAVGHPLIGVLAALGSLGLFCLTIFVEKVPFLTSAGIAALGMLGFLILAFGL
jgi:hypothetical protein